MRTVSTYTQQPPGCRKTDRQTGWLVSRGGWGGNFTPFGLQHVEARLCRRGAGCAVRGVPRQGRNHEVELRGPPPHAMQCCSHGLFVGTPCVNLTGTVCLVSTSIQLAVLNTTQREAAGEPRADPETPPQLCPAEETR